MRLRAAAPTQGGRKRKVNRFIHLRTQRHHKMCFISFSNTIISLVT